MLSSYILIFKYLVICFLIVCFLVALSLLIVPRLYDEEKISIYECGFNPYGDSRSKFEVRFYLVAILFIVFDLELTFLFPWVILIYKMTFWSFVIMLVFLIILLVGFIYELFSGSLDWNE